MDKYIVYKTGSGLGPQSVRKSSIIEFRFIDCINRTPPPPPPLGWSFFELAHGGVWDFHIAVHLGTALVAGDRYSTRYRRKKNHEKFLVIIVVRAVVLASGVAPVRCSAANAGRAASSHRAAPVPAGRQSRSTR